MNTKKRISVIGIVGVPAKYGGFETFADYLSKYVGDEFELTIYCSSKSYSNKIKIYNKARIKYVPLKATGFQSIPYDILSMLISLNESDVYLVLGYSGAIFFPFIKNFTNKRVVCNLAGLEWKRSKWNFFIRWFLKFSEKSVIRYSDAIIVDNQGLYEYVLSKYSVESKIIPYGGDQVSRLALSDELIARFPFLQNPYCCAVARIQPDNNIEMILEAFEKMPERNLVFIGNWNSCDYGIKIKEKYRRCGNIHLLNPIYDLGVLDQVRSNCVIYIHGHSAGGTNPSLVEAMSLGLPIVAYDVNFNRYTTKGQALYFSNSNQLVNVLNSFSTEEQKITSSKMASIAQHLYKWEYVVGQYEKLF